jgi:hypothetical protein
MPSRLTPDESSTVPVANLFGEIGTVETVTKLALTDTQKATRPGALVSGHDFVSSFAGVRAEPMTP